MGKDPKLSGLAKPVELVKEPKLSGLAKPVELVKEPKLVGLSKNFAMSKLVGELKKMDGEKSKLVEEKKPNAAKALGVTTKPQLGKVSENSASAESKPEEDGKDVEIEFVSFAMAPVTASGKFVWAKMMETYAELSNLDDESCKKPQKRTLRFYEQ